MGLYFYFSKTEANGYVYNVGDQIRKLLINTSLKYTALGLN